MYTSGYYMWINFIYDSRKININRLNYEIYTHIYLYFHSPYVLKGSTGSKSPSRFIFKETKSTFLNGYILNYFIILILKVIWKKQIKSNSNINMYILRLFVYLVHTTQASSFSLS